MRTWHDDKRSSPSSLRPSPQQPSSCPAAAPSGGGVRSCAYAIKCGLLTSTFGSHSCSCAQPTPRAARKGTSPPGTVDSLLQSTSSSLLRRSFASTLLSWLHSELGTYARHDRAFVWARSKSKLGVARKPVAAYGIAPNLRFSARVAMSCVPLPIKKKRNLSRAY